MEKYYLWLLLVAGEGAPEITQLLKANGSAEAAYEAFRTNTAAAGSEIAERAERITLAKAEAILEDTLRLGIRVITIDSPDYPETLKNIENPPCVLFAFGNTELLRRRLVTVVGSRKVTAATRSAMPETIRSFGHRYTIVSSLSEGCDQLTCLNALKYGVDFIEVLPCGITQTYPAGSRTLRRFLVQNGGLLITEMLPRTRASNASFLRRSRIIGGISAVTLVLQAGEGSGALATAACSKAPIFLPPADPSRPEYAGTVAAVRKGFKMFYGPVDIEAAFRRAEAGTGIPGSVQPSELRRAARAKAAAKEKPADDDKKTTPPPAPESTAEESDFESPDHYGLYTAIAGLGHPASAEELIAMTGHTPGRINELLLDLEIAEKIVNMHNRYTVT